MVDSINLTTGKFERSHSQVGESSVHSSRKTHSGCYLPITSENINAKQSRKVTSSDRFIRTQETKAPVTYCDHAFSVVCRPSVVRPLDYIHFQLLLQNRLMVLMKLGMDEVLKVPYKCCCFSARSAQERIQGKAKIGHGGPLLQRTSSERNATASNRMHSSDLQAFGKKCCYFWFHSEVKFWRVFDVFLDLVFLVYFNAISIDFYEVKSFICINFV